MGAQSKDPGGRKYWESVHSCPRCALVINLEEIDLRAITTGIITCRSATGLDLSVSRS